MCKCKGKCGCNMSTTTKGDKGDAGATGPIGLTGNVGPVGLGYLSAKVTLTSAQILALFTTPIQIVASPGIGFALQVIQSSARLNYNTIPYTGNTQINIINTGAGNSQYVNVGVLSSNISIIGEGYHTIGTTNVTQIIENTALNISINIGNPSAGNSTVDVYLIYRIITL